MPDRTCIRCGEKATKIWRIDLDTNGIAMCNDCEDQVTIDIIVANIGGAKGWEEFGKTYDNIQKKLKKGKKK